MMIKDMIPLLGIKDTEPPWEGDPIAIRATLQGEQSQDVHILEIEGELAFVQTIGMPSLANQWVALDRLANPVVCY